MFRYIAALVLFSFLGISFAQNSLQMAQEKEQVAKSYPMPGGEFFRQQEKDVALYLKQHPDYFSNSLHKVAGPWGFKVGDTHTWYSWDLSTTPETQYTVTSTCRAVGVHCYVFVADDVWGKTVNDTAVAAVVNEWDNKTPADPNKGIYQTDVDTFGNPPDVDNDPRIIIFILDIKDGYNPTAGGGYVAGFFNATNEVSANKAEIYYMDANPTDLTDTTQGGGLSIALETAAHEFQHMINWNYHKGNDLTFINEGLSMVAEMVCGYPASMQSLFAGEPNHYLFDWRGNDATAVLNDYARAQRYFLYLKEQFGVSILGAICQNTNLTGQGELNYEIKKFNSNFDFNSVFKNWNIANILDDRSVDTTYGYIYPGLPKMSSTKYGNPNVASSDYVSKIAADYITFTAGSNLNVKFNGPSSTISVKAVEVGTASKRVLDVPLGTVFNEPEFGTTYGTIHFVINNIDPNYPATVYDTATGNISTTVTELKWDNTEPTGYLNLPAGDSVCVVFDAVSGGILDSVRIGLRQQGSINGGVWTYNSNFSVSPLQKKLAGPFTASTSTKPPYPYPVPYPNWSKIDLTSSNIPTDNAFAVAFVIPTSNDPKVMITETPGTSFANSYTYETTPSSGSPRWLYYTSSNNTTYEYLIRAYVSYTVTGVKQETVLTPKEFDLAQNYPNPFNPSTKIDFTIPVASKVRVTIYNQLGQEIAEIANGDYGAGLHEINFNAAHLASGVYYYRIIAGSFVQTKKMILMK